MKKRADLVFIPSPGLGHLVSMVEFAKLLVTRENNIYITVFITKLPFDTNIDSYLKSFSTSTSSTSKRISFINIPNTNDSDTPSISNRTVFLKLFIENHKSQVKNAVANKLAQSNSDPNSPLRLTGFIIDMFCSTMIDVANEFGVPTYLFYTSGAAVLGLMFHLQALHDYQNFDVTELNNNPEAELNLPYFAIPVPAKVLPAAVSIKESALVFVEHFRRFRQIKGILVNSVKELESHALNSLLSDGSEKIPPIYPVGPILNLNADYESSGPNEKSDVFQWLDAQPLSSVVFLCFGGRGSFSEDQVKEIAYALEHCGYRFLWSVREELPDGFLKRTAEIGKVIGWAPQVAILAHSAIGGFVSHCGWNSNLESIWFGVPVATWPLYAEQQLNAFQRVKELGLGVDISLDYRSGFYAAGKGEVIVKAREIERGIKRMMENESGNVKKKIKEMSEKCRKALMDGGSSYSSLQLFLNDVYKF